MALLFYDILLLVISKKPIFGRSKNKLLHFPSCVLPFRHSNTSDGEVGKTRLAGLKKRFWLILPAHVM